MPREFASRAIYVVRPGDTLSGIARAHDVALDTLIAANAALVTNPNVIRVGWELVIPGAVVDVPTDPPAGAEVEVHTVVSGDTLSGLAGRWGTTVAAIAELNGIVNPNLLAVGQRLRRPAAGGAVVAATTTTTATTSTTSTTVTAGITIQPRGSQLEFKRWPLPMPPARVSGGYREDYGGYLHRGIDIGGVPVGTPIVAPAAGIVTTHRPGDGWGSGSFGICVILDHPGTPWWSIYAHMDRTNRTTGEHVEVGDVIGFVGFTGRVVPPGPAGAHLHWQLSAHAWFPPDFQYTANPLDFLRP
jgi:murein DD-endopeptidase MepM/ murein hydrolase activator NlpD